MLPAVKRERWLRVGSEVAVESSGSGGLRSRDEHPIASTRTQDDSCRSEPVAEIRRNPNRRRMSGGGAGVSAATQAPRRVRPAVPGGFRVAPRRPLSR